MASPEPSTSYTAARRLGGRLPDSSSIDVVNVDAPSPPSWQKTTINRSNAIEGMWHWFEAPMRDSWWLWRHVGHITKIVFLLIAPVAMSFVSVQSLTHLSDIFQIATFFGLSVLLFCAVSWLLSALSKLNGVIGRVVDHFLRNKKSNIAK